MPMTQPFLAPSPYLKLGFFGTNTSGGSRLTQDLEQWDGSWADNAALARMAEEAGLDFLLHRRHGRPRRCGTADVRVQLNAKSFPPTLYTELKIRFADGHGGYPLVGSPDDVADGIERVGKASFFGLTIGFVNALREFPLVPNEVLPRLVARGPRAPIDAEPA